MRIRRWVPEILLSALVVLVFVPPLATLELWDRREEHVAADAIDTLQNGNWLVSYDHGLPRLKKPPLVRWCSALSLAVTGWTNEFAVRLPAGLAALGTAVLLYLFGTLAWPTTDSPVGRSCGIAAVLLFSTNFLVVSEMWVMSAEPMLTLCVSSAIFSFWKSEQADQRRRWWLAACSFAVGLGVLTKGPIAIVVVAIAATGYLITVHAGQGFMSALRAVRTTIRQPVLWFPALVLCLAWGGMLLSQYPDAPQVWLHEMTIKVSGTDRRSPLILAFLPMAAPWIGLTIAGVLLPLRNWPGLDRRLFWLIWWWALGNVIMFSFWTGAREPYYLACMPAVVLLAAIAWSAFVRHLQVPGWSWWKLLAEAQWGISIGMLVAIPVAAWLYAYELFLPALALSLITIGCWLALWRSRSQLPSLAILTVPLAVALFTAGTFVAPEGTQKFSLRQLGAEATQWAKARQQPIWFINDLGNWTLDYMDSPDVTEGMWLYTEPAPQLIGDVDQLAAAVQSHPQVMLVVVSDRQYQLLQADSRMQVTVLADAEPKNRPKTLLLEVHAGPADPQPAKADIRLTHHSP